MNQDNPLKVSLNIHWGYSGKSASLLKDNWILWHHGHGPVKKVEMEASDKDISPEEFVEVSKKVVEDLEARWRKAVDEFVQEKREHASK